MPEPENLGPALFAAIRFYDHMRQWSTERHARIQAEFYLRRKVPELERIPAAEFLADALARRAFEREAAREQAGEILLAELAATS